LHKHLLWPNLQDSNQPQATSRIPGT